MSSAQAIARLRHSSGERRVGHGGTLDPAATGVLPVLFGRATVLADRVGVQGKAYVAEVRLGAVSDTDDADGTVVVVPMTRSLSRADVEAALPTFVGEISQRPPAYSAIKLDGRRSYALARAAGSAGTALPVPATRLVTVHALHLLAFEPGEPGPRLRLEIECGSGFYVRALARDLAQALGTGGHLVSLVRTRVGAFTIQRAVSLEAARAEGASLEALLQPCRELTTDWLQVPVDEAGCQELRHGRTVPAAGADGPAAAIGPGGRLVAIGRAEAGRFLPRRLVELG